MRYKVAPHLWKVGLLWITVLVASLGTGASAQVSKRLSVFPIMSLPADMCLDQKASISAWVEYTGLGIHARNAEVTMTSSNPTVTNRTDLQGTVSFTYDAKRAGRDRIDLVHRMSTNDLLGLAVNEGRATVLTTASSSAITISVKATKGTSSRRLSVRFHRGSWIISLRRRSCGQTALMTSASRPDRKPCARSGRKAPKYNGHA